MHASAGWYGDHTVDATNDGVTVRKGLDLDTLALPALKFEIRSDRDHPVGVRVVDDLPTSVDPDRVGVHTDFGADQWTAFEDGRVTFTTRLDPERPVVTLYGIWLDEPDRAHELLGRPSVKVTSDPDAPSLEPVGDEVRLPTVDDSLRSVGPEMLADLRADVEDALTAARAEPTEPATALPAPGDTNDGDDADPDVTMGDHAWTYPVERMGTGRIAAPTHADLDALVDDEPDADAERGRDAVGVGEGHVYLRAALADTHHGGGGALLLQELANAFKVVARRITGDDDSATVDAVVKTPLGTDAVLQALADRDQVTDALVSPLVGDPADATGIDAEPEDDTETADRDDTEEVSIEPDEEDVEVVLNADGERFSELKAEFEVETDTDVLEDELAEMELPGLDTSDEPSIDELVAGDDIDEDRDDETAFVPASVDGSDALSFDDDDTADETGLDFAADAANAFGADAATDDAPDDDAAVATEGALETDDTGVAADSAFETDESSHEDEGGEDGDAFEFATSEAVASPDTKDDATADSESWTADDDATTGDEADVSVASASENESDLLDVAADDVDDVQTVEVPVEEFRALRAELRELRDRVATLEADLVDVRAARALERDHEPETATADGAGTATTEGGDSYDDVDASDD
jgi:hypothetical protein